MRFEAREKEVLFKQMVNFPRKKSKRRLPWLQRKSVDAPTSQLILCAGEVEHRRDHFSTSIVCHRLVDASRF